MVLRVTFIGLGRMGLVSAIYEFHTVSSYQLTSTLTRDISENLLYYGNIEKPLVIYNRTKEKGHKHSLRLGNYQDAESILAAVSASDIVWQCLQGQEAVAENLGQDNSH